MLKIAVSIVGALTQGLDLSPHAIMQIGMELEKFIAPRLIHLAATSFGTGPRVRVSGEYKAFTCFGAAQFVPKNYRRRMAENSILTGVNDTRAFLSVEAMVTIARFHLNLRDKALLQGFHQIVSIHPQICQEPPLVIPGVRESNPSSIFRSLLLNQQGQAPDPKRSSRKLLGVWGEFKERLTPSKSNKEPDNQEKCPCSGPSVSTATDTLTITHSHQV